LICFLSFQRRQASKLFDTLVTCPEGTLCPIFHQDSSRCPLQDKENGKTPATPPPPLQSPPPRQGKWKDARDTAAAAAVTAATSDRRGTLAAVGLSLLWAALSPGAIAMVARGINTLDSPTRVCALNETSSTGRPRNLVSEF
jgi:hypothetical protein